MQIRLRLRHHTSQAALLLAVMYAFTSQLNGQGSTNAAVLGTVTDAAGAVVPNASVQVKNVGTGQAQQTATDAQGRYTIADLPVGNYEAQATPRASKPRCAEASR